MNPLQRAGSWPAFKPISRSEGPTPVPPDALRTPTPGLLGGVSVSPYVDTPLGILALEKVLCPQTPVPPNDRLEWSIGTPPNPSCLGTPSTVSCAGTPSTVSEDGDGPALMPIPSTVSEDEERQSSVHTPTDQMNADESWDLDSIASQTATPSRDEIARELNDFQNMHPAKQIVYLFDMLNRESDFLCSLPEFVKALPEPMKVLLKPHVPDLLAITEVKQRALRDYEEGLDNYLKYLLKDVILHSPVDLLTATPEDISLMGKIFQVMEESAHGALSYGYLLDDEVKSLFVKISDPLCKAIVLYTISLHKDQFAAPDFGEQCFSTLELNMQRVLGVHPDKTLTEKLESYLVFPFSNILLNTPHILDKTLARQINQINLDRMKVADSERVDTRAPSPYILVPKRPRALRF